MSNLLSNIPYELFSYVGGGIFVFIILYKFFPKLFIKIHKYIVVIHINKLLNNLTAFLFLPNTRHPVVFLSIR